jgi:hypothetical protein
MSEVHKMTKRNMICDVEDFCLVRTYSVCQVESLVVSTAQGLCTLKWAYGGAVFVRTIFSRTSEDCCIISIRTVDIICANVSMATAVCLALYSELLPVNRRLSIYRVSCKVNSVPMCVVAISSIRRYRCFFLTGTSMAG